MFDKLLDIVAPHTCCGCGHVGTLLCEHCINNIISEPFPFCLVCQGVISTDNLCRACQKNTPWENAWVVGVRKDSLKELIDLYKFERARAADEVLANLLVQRLPCLPSETVVTYIPTTASHGRQRGYNTMERIAAKVAKDRGLVVERLIERTQDIVQRGASRQQRIQQQHGALAALQTDRTGPILLIDDIYTTGGTLRAATMALRETYKQPVYVGIIARQPFDSISDL